MNFITYTREEVLAAHVEFYRNSLRSVMSD